MIEKFNSITQQLETPDGTAYIQIFESAPGKIDHIFMSVGKAGSSLNAYAYALSQMATVIVRKTTINDAIALLLGIASDRPARTRNGITCKSGPEALAIALNKYKSMIPVQLADTSRRNAYFTNPR